MWEIEFVSRLTAKDLVQDNVPNGFTVAPFDGPYECVLECVTPVKKGDVVGYLHDFDHIDMPPWPARAGADGVVLAQAWVSPIPRGQHIVVGGKVLPYLSRSSIRCL